MHQRKLYLRKVQWKKIFTNDVKNKNIRIALGNCAPMQFILLHEMNNISCSSTIYIGPRSENNPIVHQQSCTNVYCTDARLRECVVIFNRPPLKIALIHN